MPQAVVSWWWGLRGPIAHEPESPRAREPQSPRALGLNPYLGNPVGNVGNTTAAGENHHELNGGVW